MKNQDAYALIRKALLKCIDENPQITTPVPFVYEGMPDNLVFGDVLSVWEALVDNQVVLHSDQGWTKTPGADEGIFP